MPANELARDGKRYKVGGSLCWDLLCFLLLLIHPGSAPHVLVLWAGAKLLD